MKKYTFGQQRKFFYKYKEKANELLNVKLNFYSMHTFSYDKDQMIRDYKHDLEEFIKNFTEDFLHEELLREIK